MTDHNRAVDDLLTADTGARQPIAWFPKTTLWFIPLLWSLYQLWIASPLPFIFRIGLYNDTQTRAIHLAFAVFLSFLAFPMFKRGSHHKIPLGTWFLALVAAGSTLYIWLAYDGISARSGAPNTVDVLVAGVGVILLMEAARRSLGFPLMAVAAFFLAYVFFGSWSALPDIVRWKGASLEKAMSHMWLTTEGVFGVALGVSSSFVFLFVLFGSLLNQGGAGRYFIKIAFSLLGHLRGGPAKAAVISSAMTGLISGSSIANVVTTGTFTIPLMRRVGFSREKAGAVEVSSSINGVLTPPVMGAVAFLMSEYVGISYVEVIKHAILPATISYLALLYIVHLEALKSGMSGLPRASPPSPFHIWLIRNGLIISSLFILFGAVYYLVIFIKMFFGDSSSTLLILLTLAAYVCLIWLAARVPDLDDSAENEGDDFKLPRFSDVYLSGLYYIFPVLILVWMLIVERKSPAVSALYATIFLMFILATQKLLKAFFRRSLRSSGGVVNFLWIGIYDLGAGLVAGARNMIGLATAMGVAGIIVGAVTLTGIGQVMAEFVEFLSGGHVLLMLFFVALISIILGMGLPATANYIVVSSLMAGVVVELGAQSGLVVPLVAVHMFCFYFGIMADATPPVGLASFAAAAISRGDPLKTGAQAFFYSLRTAVLPFLFIFNTDLLLIGTSFFQAIGVFIIALIAMLLFAASTMGYMITRSRLYESLALLFIAFMLFRPGFFLDRIIPPYEVHSAAEIYELAALAPDDADLRLRLEGISLDNRPVDSIFLLPLGISGREGQARIEQSAGLAFRVEEGEYLVDYLDFAGPAEKLGIGYDWRLFSIEVTTKRPAKEFFFIPAFCLLALIVFLQNRRAMRIKTRQHKEN